jgi:cytoskeletal protein RodZ
MQVLSDAAVAPRPDNDPAAPRRALTAVPDRAAREAAAALARHEYCAQLKQTRERRGISLYTIAERTKVNESLFAALERNDLSRWPTGIYKRAFFREYANAVGLPAESAVGEFLQFFPDEEDIRTGAAPPVPSGPLRMTLAGPQWLRLSRVRLVASAIDIALVALITLAITWWLPMTIGTTAAVVAVIYYSLATAWLASSPALWWLRTRGHRSRAKALRLAR